MVKMVNEGGTGWEVGKFAPDEEQQLLEFEKLHDIERE